MVTATRHTTLPTKIERGVSADTVWVMNGRVVSHTLSEPSIKKGLIARRAERTGSPKKIAELKAHYIARGILTPQGKLSKRYGG